MSHDDSGFFKTFIVVLGALVVFTVFIAVIANMYSPKADRTADPLVQQELKRQIEPVGRSRIAADDAVVAETATPAPEVQQAVAELEAAVEEPATDSVTAEKSEVIELSAPVASSPVVPASVRVRAVVATNCAGCHNEGLDGAPRSDDAQAWQMLEQQGIDKLAASVINGKGSMLPRAETSLTDEEIKSAIQLMIAQAGQSGDAATQAAAPETQAAPAANDAVANDAAEDAASADAATDDAVQGVAVAADIPDNVKSVVDSLCAGCHIAGVANAPKFGDKAAWDEKMSAGMDKVLATAIAGKGAMPPRGGSALSDAELRQAIEYMISK